MTNFVFSRREMQARINDLAEALCSSQLTAIIKRLNAMDSTRLHAMWELLILHGLSQAGHLQHEQPLPNGRCPDFHWTVTKHDGEELMIVGDVTTISDEGLDAQNPLKYINDEVSRLASKFKLRTIDFWIDVRGETTGPRHRSRMRLMLPERSEILTFSKTELEAWFYEINEDPTKQYRFERVDNSINIKIIYTPNRTSGGGSDLSPVLAPLVR